MDLTQKDYDERKKRLNEGGDNDEDRRLVKLYESEGFEPSKGVPDNSGTPAAVNDTDAGKGGQGATAPGHDQRTQASDTGPAAGQDEQDLKNDPKRGQGRARSNVK